MISQQIKITNERGVTIGLSVDLSGAFPLTVTAAQNVGGDTSLSRSATVDLAELNTDEIAELRDWIARLDARLDELRLAATIARADAQRAQVAEQAPIEPPVLHGAHAEEES